MYKFMMERLVITAMAAACLAISLQAGDNIGVAIYRMDKSDEPVPADGVFAALNGKPGMNVEYVYDFSRQTLDKFEVLILCQTAYPAHLPPDWMDVVRNWVESGHGLMVTHDAVGYRQHKSFFPKISEGTGNVAYDNEPYSRQCCIARRHGLTAGFNPGERFYLGYYDYITINPGTAGMVVVRGVEKTETGAVSSAPVVVCGAAGAGRYVANGMALGALAPGGVAEPVGGEKQLLMNAVSWLAGSTDPLSAVNDCEVVGAGADLGPVEPDLLANGSVENIGPGGKPPGWGFYTGCGAGEWGVSAEECHGGSHSAYVKATGHSTVKRSTLEGLQVNNEVSVGLVAGESDGYNGGKAMWVLPRARYRGSFWLKGDPANKRQPAIKVSLVTWKSDKGDLASRHVIPLFTLQATPAWQKYTMQYLSGDAKMMAILVQISGTDETVSPGTTVYVDDMAVHKDAHIEDNLEGVTIDNIMAACEEVVPAEWADSSAEPERKMSHMAAGTPIAMPAKEITAPVYDPLPEGWRELDLSGLWKIVKLADTTNNPADDQGARDKYWMVNFDDSAWNVRPVPSCWDNEDKDYPDGMVGYGKHGSDFNGVGWYRHCFSVPECGADRRYFLRFQGADYAVTAYLNGHKIGEHKGGDHPFEFDVTGVIACGGTNLLAVRVFDDGGRYHIDGRWHTIGGLYDRVLLHIRPEIHVQRLLVNPCLSNSCVNIDMDMVNCAAEEKEITLSAEVCPSAERGGLFPGIGGVTTVPLGKYRFAPGTNQFQAEIRLDNPVLWTDACPFLYTLRLTTRDGVVGKERFGFREFSQSGRFLYLNGKRVFLRGTIFNPYYFGGLKCIEIDNRGNAMRRMLLAYKSWGCNTIFPQSIGTVIPRMFYDCCDELGIMIYDWSGYSLSEMHELQSTDNLARWFIKRYNHPAVVLTALNDEGRHGRFVEITNESYDRLKRLDKQNRPICACSGNDPNAVTFKTDVEDVHAYPGAIGGNALDMGEIIRQYNQRVWRAYGQNLPVLNWEMGGARFRYPPQGIGPARTALAADPADKNTMLGLIEDAEAGYEMLTNIRRLSLYGIRRYIFDDHQRAEQTREDVNAYEQIYVAKGEFEECRRLGDLIQGTGPNISPGALFYLRENGSTNIVKYGFARLADSELLANEAYATFRRCYNPRFICLNVFDKNVFAGGKFAATVYAINDTSAITTNWSIRVVIKNGAGQRLCDQKALIGDIDSFKRKLTPFTWDIPGNLSSGFYQIELFLMDGNELIADNEYRFFVMGRNDLDTAIPAGGRKVALYSGRCQDTAGVLDSLNVPYSAVEDFDDLSRYDVLIIGSHSVDDHVNIAGPKIREWLMQGGRLLQYEQTVPGQVSYIPQLNIVRKYGGTVADMIEINHPVFDKIRSSDNWDRWSGILPEAWTYGRVGGIYCALIGPLNNTMLATGVLAIPRETDKAVQMLISEARIGKGIALISQAEATRRYGHDSVATKYLQNTLKYILSNDAKYARPVSGMIVGNIDYRRCGYLVLTGLPVTEALNIDEVWASKAAKGFKRCGSVRFNVGKAGFSPGGREIIDLAGRMQLMAPEWEAEKRKQDVNQQGLVLNKVEAVFFLHAGMDIPDHGQIGRYIFVYEDGTRREESLIAGVNIGRHTAADDLENAGYAGNGFYISRWINPEIEKALQSIVVEIERGRVVIAGITAPLVREKLHD